MKAVEQNILFFQMFQMQSYLYDIRSGGHEASHRCQAQRTRIEVRGEFDAKE
jgi:hypothetical protein